MKALGVAALLACLGAVLTAGSAAAHADFVTSNPAPDSQVTAVPAQVSIVFTQAVTRSGTRITVTGPGGDTVSGQTTVSSNTASAPLQGGGPGTYTVAWVNVSADDGHEKSGSFRFTVVQAAAAPPSGQPAAPAQPAPSRAAAAPRTGTGTSARTRGTSVLLLATLALAGGGVAIALRRVRSGG
jgi:methionine-rich copper-binding protein CopC